MHELEALLQLLKIEQEEDFKTYQQRVVQSPVSVRRKQGLSWYPVKVINSEIGTGEKLYLTVERTSAQYEPHVFQSGSAVSLFANIEGEKNPPSLAGTVSLVYPNTMKIAFNAEEMPDWIDDGKLGVDVLFDNTSYKEMETAVRQVIKADKDRLAALRDVISGKNPAFFRPMKFPLALPSLNASQNEALRNVLSAQDIAIIHGPPGTGKTTTLVQTVRMTLKDNPFGEEKQVLVTAPSNTAVDLLTEKIAAQGISVVRIGNPARISNDIMPYSLDEQISNHPRFKELKKLRKDAGAYRDLASKYKRNFGPDEREQRRLLLNEARNMLKEAEQLEKYIVRSILENTQVITATLVGVANKLISHLRFSTVFIDEAAQALEPACWIPITRADRVVLAGDHCQLPPTVKSFEADKKGLSKTLFEKCMHRLPNKVDVMLQIQYRMHEHIMNFSSQQFYENQLEAHESVRDAKLSNDQDNFILSAPLEFVDTAGCGFTESFNPETESIYNDEEARLLVRHLDALFEHLAQTEPEVLQGRFTLGIISPYKAQVRLLTELLTGHAFRQFIEINTVDGFQGQERDVIYISLVRSNEKGEIGFLKDTRRMNVAMTRARKKLVIIGDSATLSGYDFYSRFLDYVDQTQSYRSAWEWTGQ